jgi:hypothetical protein
MARRRKFKQLKPTKTMETTKLLNQVYMEYYNQYGENDTDDVQISVILDRIDELQSEIENLNT